MEFGVLGPVEVRRDGDVIALPGAKPRVLLARLLIEADAVVSADALVDAVWGAGTLPQDPAATLQVYVSNLRRALGSASIETVGPGYVLRLEGHHVDADHLHELVGRARRLRTEGDHTAARAAALEATRLRRGRPYADVADEEWARGAVLALEDLFLAAHEELHAAAIAAGDHDESIPALEGLVAQHPFHERLRVLLVLALYRAGRQTDALRSCADGRDRMVEELGVEPGAELRQLELRILQQDPDLDPPVRTPRIAPTAPGDGDDDDLVGRAVERSVLREVLAAAVAHGPQVVLVQGEPGVGKTAVGEWLSAEASTLGYRVATARGLDVDGAPPLWPWRSALKALEIPEPDGDAATPFVLFESIVTSLAQRAEAQPILVVLDDAQWADDASIDLVRFAARSRDLRRVAVVVLHRSCPSAHPLSRLAADLATERSTRRLHVRGLEASEVAQMARQLGVEAAPEVLGALAVATGGNPFYVRELVDLIRRGDGTVDPDAAAVPATVRDVLHRRAAALGEGASEVLTVAAFASGTFTAVVIARALGLDTAPVDAVLDAAVGDGLLAEDAKQPGRRVFAHDIIRHAFYDAVPAGRRAALHRRLGTVIAELLGDRADEHASELAAHFAQAAAIGAADEAVHWARRAASSATAALAYSDAVHQLRRALFMTRRHLRDRRLECEVLLELQAAARLAADVTTATTAEAQARRAAAELGDPVLVERARSPMLRTRPSR